MSNSGEVGEVVHGCRSGFWVLACFGGEKFMDETKEMLLLLLVVGVVE
jgi:hypothetical protein